MNAETNRIGLGKSAKVMAEKMTSPKGFSLPPIYPPNPTRESYRTDPGSFE